jgi:hypothetical protein
MRIPEGTWARGRKSGLVDRKYCAGYRSRTGDLQLGKASKHLTTDHTSKSISPLSRPASSQDVACRGTGSGVEGGVVFGVGRQHRTDDPDAPEGGSALGARPRLAGRVARELGSRRGSTRMRRVASSGAPVVATSASVLVTAASRVALAVSRGAVGGALAVGECCVRGGEASDRNAVRRAANVVEA